MGLLFRWNESKAKENLRRHGLSFKEASTAFGDPLSVTIEDGDHSYGESRYILLGETVNHRVVAVAHAERHGEIRIISARFASRGERRSYEGGQARRKG